MTAPEKVFMKLRKIRNYSEGFSETSEYVCFCFMTVSYEVCIHTQNFFGVVKNKLQALNIY